MSSNPKLLALCWNRLVALPTRFRRGRLLCLRGPRGVRRVFAHRWVGPEPAAARCRQRPRDLRGEVQETSERAYSSVPVVDWSITREL